MHHHAALARSTAPSGRRARRLPRLAAVVAAVALITAGSGMATAAAGEPDPAKPEDQVHDIVFPVVGTVSYTNDYEAPRSGGRVHHATDLMGAKMLDLVAAADGTVTFITIPQASYGYLLEITADDGWVYTYVHINNDTPGTDDGQAALSDVFGPGIQKGARVAAGQLVGYLGDSGNAEGTAPHLHFEMQDPTGQQVNPYWSLNAATRLSAPAGAGGDISGSSIPRIAGIDRVATAVEASRTGWSSSPRVVIASGQSYAESLPASVLAADLGAPLLLATGTNLTDVVAAELERLGASTATVVGSVDGAIDAQLSQRGLAVRRIGTAGDVRATMVAVARALGGEAGVALLVNADTFADGISASALAAGRGWPILLSSSSYIFQESVDTWRELGIREVILVGGSAVLGDNIQAFVAGEGLGGTRLAGADRYGTSAAVARSVATRGGRTPSALLLATGTNHPDALAAGALAAKLQGHLVLVDGSGRGADDEVAAWVSDVAAAVETPWIMGGARAVGATADSAIEGWLGR